MPVEPTGTAHLHEAQSALRLFSVPVPACLAGLGMRFQLERDDTRPRLTASFLLCSVCAAFNAPL